MIDIAELKRLCEKAIASTKETESCLPASLDLTQKLRALRLGMEVVLEALNGDPTELKKMAGEE